MHCCIGRSSTLVYVQNHELLFYNMLILFVDMCNAPLRESGLEVLYVGIVPHSSLFSSNTASTSEFAKDVFPIACLIELSSKVSLMS